MGKKEAQDAYLATGMTPAQHIDAKIAGLDDWRGPALAKVRKLIHEALPEVVEEVKWGGTAIWEKDGIICTGEIYKGYIKTTFAKGASLPDPKKLFNSSLDGGTRRAIDFRQGEAFDEAAFKALVRAAAELNALKPAKAKKKAG